MNNPFEVIDSRLSNIETLLLDIKHGAPKLNKEEQLPELLTRQQVAEYLHVSIKTVDNIVKDGHLKKYSFSGSTRFKREDVRAVPEHWEPYQRSN